MFHAVESSLFARGLLTIARKTELSGIKPDLSGLPPTSRHTRTVLASTSLGSVGISANHKHWKSVARQKTDYETWRATFPKSKAHWVWLRRARSRSCT